MLKQPVKPITEGNTRGSVKGGTQKTTSTTGVKPKTAPPPMKKR